MRSRNGAKICTFLFIRFVVISIQESVGNAATTDESRSNFLSIVTQVRHRYVRLETVEVVDQFACISRCLHEFASCKAVYVKNERSPKRVHSCHLLAIRGREMIAEEWKSDEGATLIELLIPSTCNEIKKQQVDHTSGVYTIAPSPSVLLPVYCDLETSGGGWTVIQRRLDGSVDFYREWAEYKHGFGNKEGEYWLGLENIHVMTSQRQYQLRIDMEDFQGKKAYVEYDNFVVGDEDSNYVLTVGKYEGTAGNSLSYHNGQQFTTKDRDNDNDNNNCAVVYHGAWWYNSCHHSNPNGMYSSTEHGKGINWLHWRGQYESVKRIEMKIRPYGQN